MMTVSELQKWGELSPAMRALPNERWRQFVYLYVAGRPTRGAAEAYRAAGFNSAKPIDQARDAFKLLCDERIMAAVAELSKSISAQPFRRPCRLSARSSTILITAIGRACQWR